MKMITRRGIFLWILSILFIVGIVFMTVSLVSNGDEWVMKRFNRHVYSNGELVGAGTIYDKNNKPLVQTVVHFHIGSGVPQYLSLEIPQSITFSKNFPNLPVLIVSGYQFTLLLLATNSSLNLLIATNQLSFG